MYPASNLSRLDLVAMNGNGQMTRILIFTFLVLFGLLINGWALFKLITGWKRSSSTNVLAFNLLFVDIMLLLSTVSLDISGSQHYQLTKPIEYKAIGILYAVHIHVFSCSIFTTGIFTVDKFRAMTRPFQYKINKRDGLIRLSTVHGISLLLSAPFLILHGTQSKTCNSQDCLLPGRIYAYILFVCQVAIPFPSVIVLQFKALVAIVAENSRTIEMSRRIVKSASTEKDTSTIERSTSMSSRLASLPEKAKSTLRSLSMVFLTDDDKEYLNELALHRRKQTLSACKQFLCIILTLTVLILPDRILTITDAEEEPGTTGSHKYQMIATVCLCISTFMNPFIYGGLRLSSSTTRSKDDRTTTQDLKIFQQFDARRRRETVIDVISEHHYENSISAMSNEPDEVTFIDSNQLDVPLKSKIPFSKWNSFRSTTTKAQLCPRVGPRIVVTEFHFTTDSREDVRLGYRPQVFPLFLQNYSETRKYLDTLHVFSIEDMNLSCKFSPETYC